VFKQTTFKNINTFKNLKDYQKGCLILGGMPIGNKQDLPIRMLEVIPQADVVVTENIEIFIELCNNYNLNHTKDIILLQYDGSHIETFDKTLEHLKNNKKVLMISDCGMPTITDPGREIVELAIENDIVVTSIPGPNVAITALALSGFPTGNFHYYGYLPKNISDKNNILNSSKTLYSTVVFLDSKTRIIETIESIENIFGSDSWIFIGVNMTMHNETLIYGNPEYVKNEMINILKNDGFIWIVGCIHNTPFSPGPTTYWTSID
jgi:16S rRNA (cytidine1402-2'-O)-methyltransferase